MSSRSLLTRTALIALLLGACGDGDDAKGSNVDPATAPTGTIDGGASAPADPASPTGAGASTGKFFAIPAEYYQPDETSTSLVPVVPSLDVADIATDKAREFDGRASMAVVDKWVFIASSSSPVVNRFEVSERGELVPAGTLNFMNYGVPKFFAIDDWGAVFVNATKAYIFNGSDGSHVVWNPTTMEITGKIAPPTGIVREGYNLESVYFVRGNRMYRIFTNLNYDTWDFPAAGQYLVVYDIERDTILSQVEESRCPQLYNRPFADEAGDIYFSGWVWTPGIALVKPDYPKSCALRVRAGQDTFDPAYKLDFGAQLTQGREAGVLRYLGNGKALLDVYHGERTTITAATDPKKVTNEPNWRLWTVDLKANTGAPLEGFDFKAGGYTDVNVDGRTFLLMPNDDYSLTTAYDVTGGKAPTLTFKIKGSTYNVARVR